MGAIAEAFAAYVQPLIDDTDGSIEEVQKAYSIGQLCYNLALLPEETREKTLDNWRHHFEMADVELDDFRRSTIDPMIRRHHAMFPSILGSRPNSQPPKHLSSPSKQNHIVTVSLFRTETDPYAPCACNSGRKYRFCCGKKG